MRSTNSAALSTSALTTYVLALKLCAIYAGSKNSVSNLEIKAIDPQHPFTIITMANTEFLSLTDWKTGEPIFLDPSEIAFIQQVAVCDQHSKHTIIHLTSSYVHLVAEDAMQVALASGRGFFGPKDTEETT